MCTLFGVTKQAYYKHLKVVELETAKEEIIVGLIQKKKNCLETGQWQKFTSEFKKRNAGTRNKNWS